MTTKRVGRNCVPLFLLQRLPLADNGFFLQEMVRHQKGVAVDPNCKSDLRRQSHGFFLLKSNQAKLQVFQKLSVDCGFRLTRCLLARKKRKNNFLSNKQIATLGVDNVGEQMLAFLWQQANQKPKSKALVRGEK